MLKLTHDRMSSLLSTKDIVITHNDDIIKENDLVYYERPIWAEKSETLKMALNLYGLYAQSTYHTTVTLSRVN